MPLNAGLQAKCSRHVGNRCRWIHFRWRPEVELMYLPHMGRHYRRK